MAKRSRTERREAARDAVRIARNRLKLAALERGGASDRPVEVASASTIEPQAASMPCAACGSAGVRVEEHAARTFAATETLPERQLRVVRVRCPRCGVARDVFYRVGTALPN